MKTENEFKRLRQNVIETVRAIDLMEREENNVTALAASIAALLTNVGYKEEDAKTAGKHTARVIGEEFYHEFNKQNSLEDKVLCIVAAAQTSDMAVKRGAIKLSKNKLNVFKRKEKDEIPPEILGALSELADVLEGVSKDMERKKRRKEFDKD